MTPAYWRVAAALATIAAVAGTPVPAAAVPARSAASPAAALAASTASSDDLEFSRDGGATWSASPPASLFGAGFLAVPGDLLEASLVIRSVRDTPTLAMVAITNASTTDPLFDSALTVRGSDGDGAGLAGSRLSALDPCAAVVPTRVLRRGETLPVIIAIAVSTTLDRQQAANATAQFDLEVALSDVGAPTLPNGCPVAPAVITAFGGDAAGGGAAGDGATAAAPGIDPASSARLFADAGPVVGYPFFAFVAGALVAGWLLVLGARRRRVVRFETPPVRHRARRGGAS